MDSRILSMPVYFMMAFATMAYNRLRFAEHCFLQYARLRHVSQLPLSIFIHPPNKRYLHKDAQLLAYRFAQLPYVAFVAIPINRYSFPPIILQKAFLFHHPQRKMNHCEVGYL